MESKPLGSVVASYFSKVENETEAYNLDVLVGTVVQDHPGSWHGQDKYSFSGHRKDFLDMARKILAELEPTPELEKLGKIETLLEKLVEHQKGLETRDQLVDELMKRQQHDDEMEK